MATAEATYSATNALQDRMVPIDYIRPSTFNPRKRFDEAALEELAGSIREHGLLEPIVVRPCAAPKGATGQTYEIVAGERRYRACKLAGLAEIPVRIADGLSDESALTLSIIENVQRVDLDPLEEAEGYRALAGLGMKQVAIAEAVNRAQPTIANRMRLLDLPESVQAKIREGALSASHGIALASFKSHSRVQEALADMAVKENWPSKKVEGYFGALSYLPEELRQYVYQFGRHNDGALWDWQVECRGACPHDAFRASDRVWMGWCLRPGCHEARLSAVAEKVAEARATGVAMLRCRDLGYQGTDYHNIDNHTTLPSGCRVGCAQRVWALDRSDQVVEICSDAKCWSRLTMAATKAQNKAGRALLIRTNSHSGEQFIGCSGYPGHCRYTEELIDRLRDELAAYVVRYGSLREEGHTHGDR